MRSSIIFMLILLSTPATANIILNEVMYDPSQCADSDCEWVELYNDGNETVNVTGWTLENRSLTGITIGAHEYIVLASELIDGDDADNESFESFWGDNDGQWNASDGNFSAYDASLSLKNNGDTIFLTNGIFTEVLEYALSWGANGNGYTLERIRPTEENLQDNWGASIILSGTPGKENSIHGTSGRDYSAVRIHEFLPDPHGDDTAPMPQGEWVELYNAGDNDIELKWSFFKDEAGHTLTVADTVTADGTVIPKKGFLVVYINGFSGFLNNGIEEIKFYSKEGTLIDAVSYADADEGSSWAKVSGYWQKTSPTPNKENVDHSLTQDSNFSLETIHDLGSDNTAEFGQTIRVNVQGYKGDETKSVLRMFVSDGSEKISKESKITISTKYTPFELAVPIQLVPNCNQQSPEKEYIVYLGWASEDWFFDTHPLKVAGITESLCEKVSGSSASSKGKFSYDLILDEETVRSGEQFNVIAAVQNDDKEHDVAVWAYVYRGSKTYSGEQEENKVKLRLQPHEVKKVNLPVRLGGAIDEGQYKLKLKLDKDQQKTTHEVTRDITIVKGQGEIMRFETFGDEQLIIETKNAEKHSIDLISFFGEQHKSINGTTLFNISLIEGRNIFFAKLVNDKEDVTDVAQLSLLKDGETVKAMNSNLELSDEGEDLLKEKLRALRDIRQKRGRVVYESSSMKISEFLPWMFVCALLFLVIALVLKKT